MSATHQLVEALRHDAGIVYYSAHELLYLGRRHELGTATNQICPPQYWKNLLAIAKTADAIRTAFGYPLQIVAAYQSNTYYKPGLEDRGAQHLTASAIDMMPVDSGKIGRLHSVAKMLHDTKRIRGGLGLLDNYIHVDLGQNLQW